MINTLQQFLDACKSLSSSEAVYELFEDSCTQAFRDTFYEMFSNGDTNEPTRAAMNNAGLLYNVKVLYDY